MGKKSLTIDETVCDVLELHSPTKNMETLGFARGEVPTQMVNVMKQMNEVSDQSAITPTIDCHPINFFIQLNIFNIIYSYHTFFVVLHSSNILFKMFCNRGQYFMAYPLIWQTAASLLGMESKISQEMSRDLGPDLFDMINQLLFSCRRIYIHFVFHPKPNVFNEIQVRTLGRPRENHDSM